MKIVRWFLLFFVLMTQSVFCQQPLSLQQRLEQAIYYSKDKENIIGYLRLEKGSAIDDSTFLYVKFALQEFIEKKVSFVLFDIDSPGGEVFAALKISKELKRLDQEFNIPVVAFVDNWALSAGALIAYSCRFIGVTEDASMGAAEPVTYSDGKMESASEKVTSALRSEFANTARLFGRNPLIAEAMVDKDILLVARKGQIIQLESNEEILKTDEVVSRKGKLLTLDAKAMLKLNVADFEIPHQPLEPLTKEEILSKIFPFSKTLLSKQPFFSSIPDATVVGYSNPKVSFYSFLRHPIIASILTLALIVGIYIEVNTPGFGVFGTLAIASLSLILLSNFAVETIQFLELIALVLGATFLAIEIFVLPGFGVIGFIGIILFLFGLFLLTNPMLDTLSFSASSWNISSDTLITRAGYFFLTLLIAFVLIVIISRFISRGKFLKSRIIHTDAMEREKGFVSFDSSSLPKEGDVGIAFTPLRPSGKVMIQDTLYEAKTEFTFVEKGERVTVVRLELGCVYVKKYKGDL